MKQSMTRRHLLELLGARTIPAPSRLMNALESSSSDQIEATLVAAREVQDIYQKRLRRMRGDGALREETRRLVSALNAYHAADVLLVMIEQDGFNAAIWLSRDVTEVFAVITKEAANDDRREASGPVR